MVFLLNIIALAVHTQSQKLDTNEIYLQKEKPPKFIKKEDNDRFRFNGRYLNSFDISTRIVESKARSDREYYHCYVSLTKCEFSNSFAFGSGLSLDAGGAIFISSSLLIISDSTGTSTKTIFTNNCAGNGGAIAGIDCTISITDATFKNNTAFKSAGAIFATAVADVVKDGVTTNRFKIADSQFYLKFSDFEYNAATELGGAVFLQLFGTTYLEKCAFRQNRAGHSGGAAFVIKTEPYFYQCYFTQNFAGNRTTATPNSLFYETSEANATISNMRRVHRGGFARSGGAIAFNYFDSGPSDTDEDEGNKYSLYAEEPNKRRFEMATLECCFNYNRAFNEDGVAFNGHSIHLAGPVQYNSFADSFDLNAELSVSVNQLIVDNAKEEDKAWMNATFNFFPFNKGVPDECKVSGSGVRPSSYDNGSPAVPKTDSTKDFGKDVPDPTEYVYVATPLTRLPYATTRSYIHTYALTGRTFSLDHQIETQQHRATISPTVSVSPTPSNLPTPTPSPSSSPTVSASVDTRKPSRSPFPTFTPTMSPNPTPTATATISATNLPTPTVSISATPTATMSPLATPSRSGASYSRYTRFVTGSETLVETGIWISHYSFTHSTGDFGEDYTFLTYGTFDPWLSSMWSVSYVDTSTGYMEYSDGPFGPNFQVDTNAGRNDSSLIPIIIGVAAALVLVIIAVILIWFFVFRKDNEYSSDDFSMDMIEETVATVQEDDMAPVTEENPLFSTGVAGVADDPFANDFEEQGSHTEVFRIRRNTIE